MGIILHEFFLWQVKSAFLKCTFVIHSFQYRIPKLCARHVGMKDAIFAACNSRADSGVSSTTPDRVSQVIRDLV